MTVREIAEKMGVSPTTVSVVLNNKPGVRRELREKIAAVLEENGYTLKKNRQADGGRILLVFYQSTRFLSMRKDDILTFTLNAVQQVCDEQNYQFLYRTANRETLPQILLNNAENADGIVLLGTEYYHQAEPYFCKTPVPLVILDRYIPELPVNTVNTDNAQSMYDLLKHIAENGHRSIGYFKCHLDYGCARDRANCVRLFSEQFGLSLLPENIVDINLGAPDTQMQITEYLKRAEHLPTVFVTENDYLAIAVIFAMMQQGIRVPEDISIAGFDNSQVCSLFPAGLTTVQVHFTEMARVAAQQLIQRIRTPGQLPVKSLISTQLVIRSSIRKLK